MGSRTGESAGIEAVLLRAATDARFRRMLLRSRLAALDSVAGELSAVERTVLQSIRAGQLRSMIDGVAPHMSARRSLLARFAGVFGIALGSGALGVGAGSCRGSRSQEPLGMRTTGERPDVPGPAVDGMRADEPAGEPTPTEGMRPDAPPPKTRGITAEAPRDSKEETR